MKSTYTIVFESFLYYFHPVNQFLDFRFQILYGFQEANKNVQR